MIRLINKLQEILDAPLALDFLAPLALRLYLAPILWVAGVEKVTGFDGVVEWFGDQEWGLGLPGVSLAPTIGAHGGGVPIPDPSPFPRSHGARRARE